ncbi:MAG: bifunctional (p)ppGpp synthetase/guanosine-3',5'-bis(diphosphate) 3'-pyrophosphohydrolase [Prevotella sp.]|jgi:guanosine-3',5'-bis(diphosphate) 3'-diphosphatase|uniref:RelA/SpoT family protein n=2 Tax=Prevotella sp. TaxID=59823 RepID=UPI004024AB16|nr:bifunctional (p)ppGpp synthetase/guanosine-3',5'-bis(diphosphate) 3'-pyrophosphohydrolase [Prevotella sp.]
MEEKFVFTEEEKHACEALTKEIHEMLNDTLTGTDVERLRTHIHSEIEARHIERDRFGLNPVLKALMTAKVAVGDIGLRRDSLLAIMLYESVLRGHYDTTLARKDFGEGVATILQGLVRVQELYSKTPIVESENFRNLLLSFAEDMRVVLIMIADRVCLMRQIRDTPNKEAQHEVAEEASYLYAPLAHKLGLYQLKSELEDLSLKYLEHDAYYLIKEKLNATKRSRDAYIERFIGPVSKHLTEAGLKFHIKGRTKSIHSIWQKMKKQKCGVDGIYDLFAIRIILDSPLEKEKMQCWQAYSIVTDMYQPNPKRLRDWISVPKSNGYECLHITVLGPEQKWVEVQIRTERMDEVAEHGLAAHWRYKGVKADGGGMEEWLASIRTALEAGDNLEVMDQFKLDLYEDEVYAFTPKGDLLKFPKGATVLDFAYHIHSRVGDTCVGGKVNGKNVSFRTPLHSGDTVEILTASNQTPKPEWLRILVTSRARAKLRLSLKETRQKQGLYAKELLERRLKNKKLDYDEATVAHLIRKMGFKEQSDFYHQIAEGRLDPTRVLDEYQALVDQSQVKEREAESAENFEYAHPATTEAKKNDDVLIIDKSLKGIDFSLARCCHPIYGDKVFGFVTVNGGIKIHRADCPNAAEMQRRFGYRIVRAQWSGKGSSHYDITLRVIGNDDIGIVSNITNIISKDEKIVMRSINIDSHDGLFSGNLVVQLDDKSKLNLLIKKLRTVKGVKQVIRL